MEDSREQTFTPASGCSAQNAATGSAAVVDTVGPVPSRSVAEMPGAHRGRLGLERVMLGEHPLRPDDQPLTLGCQTLEVLPAIDEGDAQLAFQLGDRRRQGGLRHVTAFRRTREVSFPGHRHEVLQLAKQHRSLLG